ncbi:arylsulfatase [Pontiella sulfatireligans]|uniref:Arylsulfatase n=1 Tax=Pontiella sulfatireligans TaxID=2750658 RepID=A0A6C2UHF3_9BACT|nr:arylsulfatase [Pontiella sulfatireligans]SPS74364.1 sulfatase S1_17 [Kiritimatiellales bacterium]VGO19620.1 Arylsulfatase [Pontiella sulfatireligans]
MKRREILFAAGAASLVPVWAQGHKQPNVILVLTDDQGYGDMSCHGNPFLKTPNIDKLHAQSVRLTDFHVDPMCAPTRAALMTGRYSARTGVWSTLNGCYIPRREEITMGHMFANGGYGTAMFGKWHLGDSYPYGAEHRGFQHVVRHGAGVVGEIPDAWNNNYYDDTYLKNGKWTKFNGFCTDVWFDECMDYVKSHKGKPFFCYLAANAPHGPFNSHEKYFKPYLEMGIPEKRARFYGLIANIDENVGRLMAFLEKENLTEDTILIFMGDNGTAMGAGVRGNGLVTDGYNAGMRGKKTMPYEGGHRNACFVRYPSAGIQGGRDVPGLAAHFDLMPTLADLCDLPMSGRKLDGISLAPSLKGNERKCPERTLIVHNMQLVEPHKYKDFAVMTSRWRLVNRGLSLSAQLFDIKADPGQTTDVASTHPEVYERLMGEYEKWWEDMTPNFKNVSHQVFGSKQENPVLLTCHSWRTPSKEKSYNQLHVRQGIAINDAYWPVEVASEGRYRIELRRWPREADVPIAGSVPALEEPFCDPLPEGRVYPVTHARLVVQDVDQTIKVHKGDKAAVFEVPLNKGQTKLQTWFTFDGAQTIGAYYVYVEKL